ncbi:hypothetical protein BGZ80_010823 [Entomortierella chlamydospora]|uniref:Beta-hexosaminidase n=1 Tax=Entomortierella chlamydospora TaxID=101097 RepID=A0A9P6SZG7_9FUNG|nr:hypothetical protein BGZ79_006341 [Entomortierella chlamydospora]KAG0013814.1 hypothetical protein BGZ80_010823 [Entomortierella chlamydospora]
MDPALVASADRSQVKSIKLESVEVEVEEDSSEDILGLETDESYRLSIVVEESPNDPFQVDEKHCEQMPNYPSPLGAKGIIRAKSLYGALHGMETFSQLVTNNPQDGTKEIPHTPVLTRDRPLFQHRGLLLDSSKDYLSMASLYRTIDVMAMNKLNVLHWHVAGLQSFPIALDDQPGASTKSSKVAQGDDQSDAQPVIKRGLPLSQLASKGVYSRGMVYTKNDISELLDYAMNRGIRVIPEIDMPGDAWSWSCAFPEITVCLGGYPSYSRFSAEPPSGQLNPVVSKTYKVVQGVYDQVQPLFQDEYFHGGADEVNANCWNNTESVLQYTKSKDIPRTNEGFDRILDRFISRQHEMLRHGNRKPLMNHNLGTLRQNKDTAIQVWTSSQNIKKTIQKGYKAIAGSADYGCLDCGLGDWLGNWILGNSWCDPYKSWQKIYSFNPVSGLNPEEAKSVLGGEALLWSEQVDDTNLDAKLWPRASAAADVLWSGNSDDSKTRLWNGPDQKENSLRSNVALERIDEHRFRMLSEKINAESLQPLWCVRKPGH